MSELRKYQERLRHVLAPGKLCLIIALSLLYPLLTVAQTNYYSRTSGNWGDASTWSTTACGGTAAGSSPSSSDNVIICSHIVDMAGSDWTINDITVQGGGQLIDGGKVLTVDNDMTCNGNMMTGGGDLVLNGVGNTIDGTGYIFSSTSQGKVKPAGSKVIAASANLTIDGDIEYSGSETITNLGTITVKNDLIGTGQWTNGVNSTLNFGGSSLLPSGILDAQAAGNTMNFNGSAGLDIKIPVNSTFHHLTVGGAGDKKLKSNTTINGNLTMAGGKLQSDNFNIDIKGNWTNNSEFKKANNSIQTFSGTNQSINGAVLTKFRNLNLQHTGTLTLNADASVENILTMNCKEVNSNSFIFSLGTGIMGGAIGIMSYTKGKIRGKFKRWIETTSNPGPPVLFPLGTSSDSTAVNITFNNVTSGSVTAEFVESGPGSSGLPLNDAGVNIYNTFVEGYWDIQTGDGFASTDFDLECTGLNFSSFTFVTPTRLLTRTDPGSPWTGDGTHVAGDVSTQTGKRTNITTISGNYALADTTNCSGPATPPIFGSTDECAGATSILYYTSPNPPDTFDWTITGGSIASTDGNDKDTIYVNWNGMPGQIGNVRCVQYNSCSNSSPMDYAVNVHSITPSSISGSANVAVNEVGVLYSVTNQSGYTYAWLVTGGGTITSGQGTNQITVDWGASGSGNVHIDATYASCLRAVRDLPITIYDIANSITTGGWGTPGTWDCTCVPSAAMSVRVSAGDIVTAGSAREVVNFIIESGGEFDDGGNGFTSSGNFTINGIYTSTGGNIQLSGSGSTISGTGNINGITEFQIQNGGKTITAGSDLKVNSGKVKFGGKYTVVNQGSFTIAGNIEGGGSKWINDVNSTINIGGDIKSTLQASAIGNTVNFNGTINQDIKDTESSSYWHLSMSTGGIKTLKKDVAIQGNLTITGVTLDAEAGKDNAIALAGNWTNTGTYLAQNAMVTLNGTVDQTIINVSGETFYNLTINKSSGTVNLTDNVTISNTLSMSAGNINSGSDKLILGTGTGNVGVLTHTAGTIIGQFERWKDATGGSVLYPVGTATYYRPATVNFPAAPTAGSLIGEFVESDPGSNGLPLGEVPLSPTDSVRNTFNEGYWKYTDGNGFASANFDLDLEGGGFTSLTINSSTRILRRASAASAWTFVNDGTHAAATGEVAHRDGLNGFPGEFCFGDTSNCSGPITGAISGDDSVCTSQTNVKYSIPFDASVMQYDWTITGGSIFGSEDNDTITVIWGGTGMIGTVQVMELNSCKWGTAISTPVTIHTLPTSVISGKTTVEENIPGEIYSVINTPGYTYTWTITGSTADPIPAAGQGTNSITVNWGAAGVGNVNVVASTVCGSAAPVDLPITIYAVINSQATGTWSTPSTWDCNCVPDPSASVRVLGHTVTLDAIDIAISNMTIESGGTVFDNGFTGFTVIGNISVFGLQTGSGGMTLSGVGTTIDGTGQIAVSGTMSITNGDKTIVSTAALNRSPGDVNVGAGLTVTNDGSFIVAGDLTGGNSASTWTNNANSTLRIGGALLSTGVLNSTSTDNTVTYEGAGQTVKAVDYYNVSTTGISTTTLLANTIIYGNVSVGASKTLIAGSFNMNVRGNWTNSGGTFTPGTGMVTFGGTGTQTITSTSGETFNHLTIASTSTLQTFKATDTIYIAGNWTNNGVFNQQTGMVTLNGSTLQTIGGSSNTSFNDMVLDNAANATISVATNMIRTLTLTSGTLTTGGLLTFISDASGTANIAEITGGGIIGNITMQRYIAGDDDWRLLGSPVGGTSLSSWNDNFTMSGFPGSNGPSMSFVSVSSYNEAVGGLKENGYTTPGGIGDGLGTGKGWFLWLGQSLGAAITMSTDLVGPANTGPVSISTTYTTSGGVTEDGWNLIANPYPSDILWDGVSLTNVTPFAYVWDPNGDSYVQYDQFSGATIPSTQAFWVKGASAGVGSVNFVEANKTGDGDNFYKTYPIPGISLVLTGNGFIDSTRIRLVDNATYNYDPMLDAYSMYSLNSMKANISSVSSDAAPIDLSINSMPKLDGDVAILIRVGFTSSVSGTNTYTISANLNTVPPGSCVLLEDVFTNTFTDLIASNTYSFIQAAGLNLPPRFLLHISAPLETAVTDVACNGYDDGQVVASAAGNNLTYTWFNANNDTLKVSTITSGCDSLIGLSPGDYSVLVNTSSSICPVQTQTFSVVEPITLSSSYSSLAPLCSGDLSGTIDLSITGGTAPYAYLWSDSSTTEGLSNLAAGNYSVTVTDNNGCTVVNSQSLTSPPALSYQLTQVDESCEGQEDGSIAVDAQGGVAPYEYIWSNGEADSTVTSLLPGMYAVTISDANNCSMEVSAIEIQTGQAIIAGYTVPTATVNIEDGGSLLFTNISIGATSYYWEFGDGETSDLEHPLHIFTAPGEYDVMLTASNGACVSTSSNMISVVSNVGVEDGENGTTEFEIYQDNGVVNVKFDLQDRITVQITVQNMLGQVVFAYFDLSVHKDNIALNLEGISQGVYTVQISTGERSFTKKITIN